MKHWATEYLTIKTADAYRDLNPNEQLAVNQGQSQLIPKIFQNYSTPIPQMMSSPGAAAAMGGGITGAMGAVGGGVLGSMLGGEEHSGMGLALGAGAGGLLGSIPGAALGYMGRDNENKSLEEVMRRTPDNGRIPNKYDFLSNKAVRTDLTVDAMNHMNPAVN